MASTSSAFDRKLRRAQRFAAAEPTEEEIHMAVVAELRKAGGVQFFHCPNEGQAKPQYRAKLKRLGLSAGVPDLVIVTPPPCGGYVAAALEIKREGGCLSDAQRGWLGAMAGAGWAVACEYGPEACLGRLRAWGYLG